MEHRRIEDSKIVLKTQGRYESRNTKPAELRFSALLGVGGVRTGDRALQYAVGQRALELGTENLRSAYLASSDEKRRAWEKYVAAQTTVDDFRSPEGRLRLSLSGNVSLREPPEVR